MIEMIGVDGQQSGRAAKAARGRSIKFTGVWGISAAFVVLFGILGVTTWYAREAITASKWVTHTFQVKGNLGKVLSALQDAETGQRGYLLTSREKYLEPYYSATKYIENLVAKIETITSDNSLQRQNVRRLRLLVTEKINELKITIGLYQTKKTNEAIALVQSDRGIKIMDQIRGIIKEMESEEARLLMHRQNDLIKVEHISIFLGLSGIVMLIGIAGIVTIRINRSLSLQKEADKLAISFAELETEIKARKLAEAELLKAKKDAENANKAKSEFLAAMSHDLRTPLNAIMGFSDMMRQKIYGPLGDVHYEDYADDINRSGFLLVSLINDLLDLSKIEAGKYELSDKVICIEGLVNTCISQFSSLSRVSNLTFTIDIASDLPRMIGDERVLIQILNNLLSNATKFSPDGGIISAKLTLNQNNQIIVKIKDAGIGMSDEDMGKAMKPFEQITGIISRKHEGTGLGLHICSNFMKLFGGSLQIESKVGMGTTVSLCFPPERTVRPS